MTALSNVVAELDLANLAPSVSWLRKPTLSAESGGGSAESLMLGLGPISSASVRSSHVEKLGGGGGGGGGEYLGFFAGPPLKSIEVNLSGAKGQNQQGGEVPCVATWLNTSSGFSVVGAAAQHVSPNGGWVKVVAPTAYQSADIALKVKC